MTRYEIINRLIDNKNYQNYLEIGVRYGECFREVKCLNKTGVDPQPLSLDTTHKMTSDIFFTTIDSDTKFDIIFIDGLHLHQQVDKDILNSLNHLSEGGTILLHDCNPPTEQHALEYPIFEPPISGAWNGNVYLSLIKLRATRIDLTLKTVDSDWGVGILTREGSEKIDCNIESDLNWNFFDSNRREILNLVSVDEFNELYPSNNKDHQWSQFQFSTSTF
jgi:hypothetical protein